MFSREIKHNKLLQKQVYVIYQVNAELLLADFTISAYPVETGCLKNIYPPFIILPNKQYGRKVGLCQKFTEDFLFYHGSKFP